MGNPITTEFGGVMPPVSRYSIAVHLPKWDTVEKFARGDLDVIKQLKTIYPRAGILFSLRRVRLSFRRLSLTLSDPRQHSFQMRLLGNVDCLRDISDCFLSPVTPSPNAKPARPVRIVEMYD